MRLLGLLPPLLVCLALAVLLGLLAVDRGPGAALYRAYQIPPAVRRTVAIVGAVICLAALFGVIGAAVGWFSHTG